MAAAPPGGRKGRGRINEEQAFASLLAAGYDLDDEDVVNVGLALYALATEMEGASERTRRTGAKIGRNDPCPCGSGKKFKRCCFGKEEKASPTEGRPLWIPNVQSMEEVERLLLGVQQCFAEFPDLQDFIPSPSDLDEYFVECGPMPDDEDEEAGDERAQEFASGYFSEASYETIAATAMDLGKALPPDDERRGPLLFAAFLAYTGPREETDEDHLDLLGIALFKLALIEYDLEIRDFVALAAAYARLEPGDATSERLNELLLEEMARSDLPVPIGSAEEMVDQLKDQLLEADVEVGAPLAAVLVAYEELRRTGSGDFMDALERVYARYEAADWELYLAYLDRFLGGNPSELQRARVALTAQVLRREPDLVTRPAILGALHGGNLADLSDPTFTAVENGEDWLAPDALRRYADYLDQRGYPSLAARTRAMIPAGTT